MQFAKMPQGYKNSPAIFQRGMNYILRDLRNLACIVYIDDILVFGKTEEEHDRNLQSILNRLEQYILQINVDKTVKKVENIEFLGYQISYNKISPTISRSQGITDFKEPSSKRELQRFLGMVNYDRNFVKNITSYLNVFYKLLNKDTNFEWGKKNEKVF
jgi:hypothetical protein